MGLCAVQWFCNVVPSSSDALFGPKGTQIYKLGKLWFLYNGIPGRIQHVNFLKQIFFPEAEGSDGYSVLMLPGTDGYFKPLYTQYETNPLKILDNVINFKLGQVGGLRQIGPSGFVGPVPQIVKQSDRLIPGPS